MGGGRSDGWVEGGVIDGLREGDGWVEGGVMDGWREEGRFSQVLIFLESLRSPISLRSLSHGFATSLLLSPYAHSPMALSPLSSFPSMHVQELGLSSQEAQSRLQFYGRNEFAAHEKEPLWRKYLEQVCLELEFF